MLYSFTDFKLSSMQVSEGVGVEVRSASCKVWNSDSSNIFVFNFTLASL